jgi:hypothetical protein
VDTLNATTTATASSLQSQVGIEREMRGGAWKRRKGDGAHLQLKVCCLQISANISTLQSQVNTVNANLTIVRGQV